MPGNQVKELIKQGRMTLQFTDFGIDEPSDQQLKLPQPPLVKEKMTFQQIDLPYNFGDLKMETDILKIINNRVSHRVYTEEDMSLLELSYLLWSTQGIKSIRGKNYATLRTVPSGGARHEFETYFIVKKVAQLREGTYHYLPLTHQIEFLREISDLDEKIGRALSGQRWAEAANVIFFWSVVPYRSEWRYSCFAHRIILVDIGHVCQNMYIACEAIGLGTCAIGAFDRHTCDSLFTLDGEDEFTILAAPVGTISAQDKDKEQEFYAFLKTEE
ncbi:MAG: SagB/ThcOx family dehydrogenase [Candidatus Izemoplasmatales bacterium]|jgi:SagB-type dehydrogenase family enzyme|nr:SagB/ThcOx family dehydrogenase [Candidatus Izemoplasmatales bacterium]